MITRLKNGFLAALGSSDLPLARDVSSRFLPFIMGVMIFLAALALATALMLDRLALRWELETRSGATLEIHWPETVEQSQRGERLDRALNLLNSTGGVLSARLVGQEESRALLAPWLGADLPLEALPMPDMIEITLRPETALDSIEIAVAGILPQIRLIPHSEWLQPLKRLATLVRGTALGIALLMLAVTVLMVSFATRAGLSIMAEMVHLLHNMGASDAYIAGEFQRHALLSGLKGGLVGLGAAALLLLGAQFWLAPKADTAQAALLPSIHLWPQDWLILLALPVIASLIAMLAARMTVLQRLRQML